MLHNERITWFHVTAIEGMKLQDDYRIDYRRWSDKKATAGGAGGGGGGGSPSVFPTYVLAANGSEATRSPTPTWVPATGGLQTPGQGAIHVFIDTDESGTLLATVFARMRTLDVGTSVQARLWDVSASAPIAGVSASVSTQTFSDVEWEVTLNPSHVYELQLLPSLANMDVIGTGWIKQHD